MPLQTPIGQLSVYFDDKPITCQVHQLPPNKERLSDINGRYNISVNFEDRGTVLPVLFPFFPTRHLGPSLCCQFKLTSVKTSKIASQKMTDA
jgi:hypothetical protein